MKNKVVAGVLAILLGGLGIHKFYLGKLGQGGLYLLFEGILYLFKSDEEFNREYNVVSED